MVVSMVIQMVAMLVDAKVVLLVDEMERLRVGVSE